MTRLALLRIASLPFDTLGALHAEPLRGEVEALLDSERAGAAEAEALSDVLFAAAGEPSPDERRAKARFAVLRLRRDVHNGRAPRQADLRDAEAALDDSTRASLTQVADRIAERELARSRWERSYEEELARSRRDLLRIAGTPLVENGIYLASRALLPKARALARRDLSRAGHDDRHTLSKIAAYVARFAAKTSPNGVFCAVALAHIGGSETGIRGSCAIERIDALLSIAEARKVTACLAVDPDVAAAVVPRSNPTLREMESGWTFWKPASPRNPVDDEVLSRIADQPVLRLLLEEAGRGARATGDLVRAVAERSGRSEDELRAFLSALVARGVLIAEVEIPYSARRPLRELAAAARRAGCEAEWIPVLERIEDAVDRVPRIPIADRIEAMEEIVRQVEPLPRTRPFKADELFRVDSASGLELTLPDRVLADLRDGVRVLVRLLAAMYPDEVNHRGLVSRFLKAYPADADVDLLDLYRGFADSGETPARPLEFPEGSSPAQRRVWEWFVRAAREAPAGGTVEVSEALARELAGDAPEPRWAAGALFQIAASSCRDIDEGRYVLALGSLFNGIGLALARFAHLLDGAPDRPVVAELRRAWSAMERPGAVLAELTFHHEARTANAGLRPVLFSHEIELPGDKATEGVDAIAIADLVIRYDSAADRLVLRSRSRGVEVIPVLSSGVSPSGIVSELVHIGRQGWQTVGYLPGFHAQEMTRWPRFVCGRTVLFRARWVFRGASGDLVSPEEHRSAAGFFLEVARWRARHGLPRHVFAHTHAEPKPFYVDLESPLLVDLLRRAVATVKPDQDGALFVTEMLPGPDEMWVRDERGQYATELLVQLEGGEQLDRSS